VAMAFKKRSKGPGSRFTKIKKNPAKADRFDKWKFTAGAKKRLENFNLIGSKDSMCSVLH
jgi:hypothetical protein